MAVVSCPGCLERDARRRALERELAQQRQRADGLAERLGAVEGQLHEALARLGTNATNSSVPPSAHPPGAPKPVAQQRTGNRPAAQPGHPARLRQRLPRARGSRTIDFVPVGQLVGVTGPQRLQEHERLLLPRARVARLQFSDLYCTQAPIPWYVGSLMRVG
jgi:hypothetical protein